MNTVLGSGDTYVVQDLSPTLIPRSAWNKRPQAITLLEVDFTKVTVQDLLTVVQRRLVGGNQTASRHVGAALIELRKEPRFVKPEYLPVDKSKGESNG